MSIIRRTLFLSRDLFSGLKSPQCCVSQRLISGLSEVGKLEAIKIGGNYDTGQMLLHKVFGYRGVVLFPWLARVYDRDLPNKTGQAGARERLLDTENPNMGAVGKEVKGRTHTYYQVLIDGRDSPYITHRAQTESVTFLGNHSENTRCFHTLGDDSLLTEIVVAEIYTPSPAWTTWRTRTSSPTPPRRPTPCSTSSLTNF